MDVVAVNDFDNLSFWIFLLTFILSKRPTSLYKKSESNPLFILNEPEEFDAHVVGTVQSRPRL